MPYYDSINNCPIQAWIRATQEQDIKSLFYGKGRYKQSKALEAYKSIQKEYINTFGIPPEYRNYLKGMGKAIKEAKKYANGDKFGLTMFKIRSKEAERFIPEVQAEPFPILLARVSKAVGFQIDPSKTTVAQFYGHIHSLNH